MNGTSPANWYPDPDVPSRLRYWDGFSWTHHYAPMPPAPREVFLPLYDPPLNELPVPSNGAGEEWRSIPPSGAPVPGPGRSRRPLRAGEVLTGLGAFALVAAGFAFLRSVWSGLGIGGQILVLLAIVLVQATASMFAVPRIRALGESLAASSAVTLLVAASWGYERLDAPGRFFPALMYGFAALHALVLLVSPANRARTWVHSASAFVIVAAFTLTAAPSPHLWALGLAACALLIARFAITAPAERFAALHMALAVFHSLVGGAEYGFDSASDRYVTAGLVALVVLAASMMLRTSYPEKPGTSVRSQTLRGAVWFVALGALGLTTTYGVLAAGPDTRARLVVTVVGFVAAALAFRVPPPEAVSSRRALSAGTAVLALMQLGRNDVLVPSARFVEDLLIAIGTGYLMLGAGLLLLVASAWRRWIPAAFAGASCAAIGWGVLLGTRLEDTFSAAPYPELFTVPAALPLFAAAVLTIRPQDLSTRAFLPGVLLLLVPSTLAALGGDGADLRFTVLVAVCVLCLPAGFRFRLHALVVPPGGVLLLLFAYRTLGLLGDSWVTLAIAALVLLVLGSLFEKMRDRARLVRTYLAALR